MSCRKMPGGPIEDRPLAALAIPLDGLVEHHGRQPESGVFLDVEPEAGLQLLGQLGGIGSLRRAVHLLEELLLPAQ